MTIYVHCWIVKDTTNNREAHLHATSQSVALSAIVRVGSREGLWSRDLYGKERTKGFAIEEAACEEHASCILRSEWDLLTQGPLFII